MPCQGTEHASGPDRRVTSSDQHQHCSDGPHQLPVAADAVAGDKVKHARGEIHGLIFLHECVAGVVGGSAGKRVRPNVQADKHVSKHHLAWGRLNQ